MTFRKKALYCCITTAFVLLLACFLLIQRSLTEVDKSVMRLKSKGIDLIDGYEVPVWPVFHSNDNDWVAPNGYYDNWIAKYFCERGFTECFAHNKKLDRADIVAISKLSHLNKLTFSCCSLPRDWAALLLPRCKRIKFLAIGQSTFNTNTLKSIPTLRHVTRIHFENLDFANCFEELVLCLTSLSAHCLEEVYFGNCGLTEEQVAKLKKRVPDLNVECE